MPSNELQGVRVLVTRPAHQAEPLCRRIEAQGGEAIRFPVLAIEGPRELQALRQTLARLGDYDWAVFVSPNAVRWTCHLLDEQGLAWPAGLKIAVVGAGTARTIEALLGRPADLCPSERFDSEGLLALPELQQMSGRRVLVLRGDGGRELLASSLRARGAEVDYAEVYRRERPAVAPGALGARLAQGAPDILAVTSTEGLHNLLAMVDAPTAERLKDCALLVVSERTAAAARELGFRAAVVVAEKASDEGLEQGLIDWHHALAGERAHD